jgi:hypothetical protein
MPVLAGTVTQANMKLSTINGAAFVDFSGSDSGALTSAAAGSMIVITDHSGNTVSGYIKSVGTGQTYGSQLLSNTAFSNTTGVSTSGATVSSVTGGQSGNALQVAVTSYGFGYEPLAATTGQLLYFTTYCKLGTATAYNASFGLMDSGFSTFQAMGVSTSTWTQYSVYGTATMSTMYAQFIVNGSGLNSLFDTASVAQVLTPATTGVTITSTANGSTYNWASVGGSFNLHDSNGYTYTIGSVAPPTASLAAGTYLPGQSVTLSDVTGGAAICYTTDGSTPTATTPGTCSHGTAYTTPISLSSVGTTTLQALGTLSGLPNSTVTSVAYTVRNTATFYVANTGSDAANGTSTATPFQTIAHVNGLTLLPGDNVLFNRGNSWAEELQVPASGASGSPVVFGAYGSGAAPVIKSGSYVTGFSVYSGNVYQRAQTTNPYSVARGGKIGLNAGSLAAVTAEGSWYWDGASYLYLYTAGNPNDGTTEITSGRQCGIYASNKSYVTVQDLQVQGVDGVTWGGAIYFENLSGTSYGITVQRVTVPYSSLFDVYCYNCASSTLQSNSVAGGWTGGAYPDPLGTKSGGLMIYGPNAAGNTVAYNQVLDGNYMGIRLEGGVQNTAVHHNIVVRPFVNGIDTFQDNASASPNLIYNNTVLFRPFWSAGHGIDIQQSVAKGTTFKNNIVYSDFTGTNTNVQLIAIQADANSTVTTDYNLYDLAPGSTASVGQLSGTTYSSLSTWQAAIAAAGVVGADAHSMMGNPGFTNYAGGNFSLQCGSAATGAGVNLGAVYQAALLPAATWTSNVQTGNQGSLWSIGAYLFSANCGNALWFATP